LRLTLLTPDVVKAILNGEKPEITLTNLLKPFSIEWHSQR
jgi:hypothetical protein